NEMKTHYAQLEPTRANNLSTIIYFKKPADQLINRYTLATIGLKQNDQSVPFAHVVVMPHIDKTILNRFLEDLA
ncbi:MAG TPA: histidine decarboxylase, partial [Nitrosomonas sp.]|nr:histidine decarboxylase [Nitrosomonas sp.]